MASLVEPESDSEDELPAGWEERATLDGRVYYAKLLSQRTNNILSNHINRSTQWTHPRTGKKKKVAGELPYGWEKNVSEDGHIFYVDHINKKTTYTDPRLAFAVEEKDCPHDFRQRFDASTMALQILHGQDLSGKVILITGGNSGIGLETARSVAFHGATTVLASRNLEKSLKVIESFKKEKSQVKLDAMQLDLTSLTNINEFATVFKSKYKRLDVLILNAAVFGVPYEKTVDGFELTFQANYLGHFYLSQLLEDLLIASSPCRVVVVSSESHRFANLSVHDLSPAKLSPAATQYGAMSAYNQSKLCNVLFANELNSRLKNKSVYVNSLHPGNMVSTSLPNSWWVYRLLFLLVRPFTKSLQQAAATSVYCAVAPELDNVGGLYFNNCCRCEPSNTAQDQKLAKELWQISEQMIKDALVREETKCLL